MIVNLGSVAAVCTGLLKNCGRCGRDFTDYTDEYRMRVCAECKKPRGVRHPPYLPPLLGQALTVREVQIVDLVADGKFNKEIAYDLHLGEGTIKQFVSTILAKTGMANRTSLAVWWVRRTH